MSAERKDFTSIRGDENLLRLPRVGKIHMGIKVMYPGARRESPKETDYFVCPPEVTAIYGPEPKELDIMFPVESASIIFSRAYKLYTGPTLMCKGNGVTALRVAGYLKDQAKTAMGPIPANPHASVEIPCPCPFLDKDEKGKSDCNAVGMLSFMLPKVRIDGVYQIDVKGMSSTKNILAGLALARGWVGKVAMIPFKLRRVPEQGTYQGKATTHYVIRLDHQISYEQIQKIRGDSFFLGMDPAIEGTDTSVPVVHHNAGMGAAPVELPPEPPPADAEEDIDPELLKASSITIFIINAVEIEGGYSIEGQEEPKQNTTVLKFFTKKFEDLKLAWGIAEASSKAEIRYKTRPDGTFELLSIEEDIAF